MPITKQNKKIRKCRLCGDKIEFLFKSKVLNKYNVSYLRCRSCELLQTESPYWLKESYERAIVDADTGLLSRNHVLSKIAASVVYFIFDKKKKHLDYAGGYGVLTRLMRDKGFDYYWTDPLAENLFARGFADDKKNLYQTLTLFEFLEHVAKPLQEMKKIVRRHRPEAMLLSTTLYKEPIDKNWWYFTYETGQHISFYTQKTMKLLADKLDYKCQTNGVNLHLLTKKRVPAWKFWLLARLWFVAGIYVEIRMKSKTFTDHLMLIKRQE